MKEIPAEMIRATKATARAAIALEFGEELDAKDSRIVELEAANVTLQLEKAAALREFQKAERERMKLEAELATFREVEMREVDDYQKVIAKLEADTKRLQFLIAESGMDGFGDHDAIDFIETVIAERGHDEPTPEDEFDGWRRMLDAAMKSAGGASEDD